MNLVNKWTEAGFMDESVPIDERRQLVYILEEAEKHINGVASNNSHMLPYSIFPHVVAKLHYERNIWVREQDMDDVLNIMYGVHNTHGNPEYGNVDLETQMVEQTVKTYHEYIVEHPRAG